VVVRVNSGVLFAQALAGIAQRLGDFRRRHQFIGQHFTAEWIVAQALQMIAHDRADLLARVQVGKRFVR